MEQEEIFELISQADENLKYAHEDNAGLRRQQARDLLVRARAAATEIGNDALVQQAGTGVGRCGGGGGAVRGAEVGGGGGGGGRGAGAAPRQSRNTPRRVSRASGATCSSLS